MPDAGQNFTEMFQKLGEQLKVPSFDVTKIMEHHQKNIDAMGRSWQAMATGATAVANKQREIFEGAIKDISEMAQDYKPAGSPQEKNLISGIMSPLVGQVAPAAAGLEDLLLGPMFRGMAVSYA